MPEDKGTVADRLGEVGLGRLGKFSVDGEMTKLTELLHEGEEVKAAGSSGMSGKLGLIDCRGLIVVTSTRVLFLSKPVLGGVKIWEFPLGQISSVSHKRGLAFGHVTINMAGKSTKFSELPKRSVALIADAISELQASARSAERAEADTANLVTQLERLTKLKDAGSLSEEEFAAMKAKLLG